MTLITALQKQDYYAVRDMVQRTAETADQKKERRLMHEWGFASVVAGGLAVADLALEGGLAIVPGLGWVADLVNLIPEMGFVGIAIFAANRFLHHRHELHKLTGRAHPESKPPQIPRLPIRRQ